VLLIIHGLGEHCGRYMNVDCSTGAARAHVQREDREASGYRIRRPFAFPISRWKSSAGSL
jgi:hypothetical protein